MEILTVLTALIWAIIKFIFSFVVLIALTLFSITYIRRINENRN